MAKHKHASIHPIINAPSVDQGGSLPPMEAAIDVPQGTLLPESKADESPATHGFYITVIHPFGQYKRGDRVRDFHDIQKIIDSGHLRFCSKTFK